MNLQKFYTSTRIFLDFFVMRGIFKVALRDDEFETEKAERGAKKDGRKNQRRDGEGGGWKND